VTCQDCSHIQYKYHSCRNRHCPSCQGGKREEWIVRQQQYLLDVPYFHVVFTLPSELRPLCMHKPRLLYNLLFRASWETIATLSKDKKHLGAQSGMTAVLHTWSQNLTLHPHLHCIVPGGGVTKAGNWKSTKSKGKFLFPKEILRPIFRGIFMKELKNEFIRRFALHILPHRFVRIRHYGILSNHGRSKVIPKIQVKQNYQTNICLIVVRPSENTELCIKCKSENVTATTLLPQKSRSP